MRELDSHYSVKQRSLNVVSQKAQETIDKIYHVSKKSDTIKLNWYWKSQKKKKNRRGTTQQSNRMILKKKKKKVGMLAVASDGMYNRFNRISVIPLFENTYDKNWELDFFFHSFYSILGQLNIEKQNKNWRKKIWFNLFFSNHYYKISVIRFTSLTTEQGRDKELKGILHWT